MSYASILVQVEASDAAAARLKCARNLAERFGATLLGVACEDIPPLGMDNGFVNYDPIWITAIQKAIGLNLEAAAKAFEAHCKGVPTHFQSAMRLPVTFLSEACRAADIVVAGGVARRGASIYQSAPIDELTLSCGRPVLVAPPGAEYLRLDKVMVAWKDTRECRRALADALPMLREAGEVLLVEACRDDAGAAAARLDDVATGLRRHGVFAAQEVLAGKTPAEEALVAKAQLFGADLVVAGAYGHSRLGEWAFGGVTRSLLDQDERFVLLSH